MHILEVSLDTNIQRLFFPTKEAAMAQLELIAPKIGLADQYGLNRDEEKSHRIVSGDSEMVVALRHVLAVRVIDKEAYLALTADSRADEDTRGVEREIKIRKALKDAEIE